MLEELAKVQAPKTELDQYMSLTYLQNKGLKRHFRELEAPTSRVKYMVDEDENDTTETVVNSIKGSKKKRLAILKNAKQDKATFGPNVLGFEVGLK